MYLDSDIRRAGRTAKRFPLPEVAESRRYKCPHCGKRSSDTIMICMSPENLFDPEDSVNQWSILDFILNFLFFHMPIIGQILSAWKIRRAIYHYYYLDRTRKRVGLFYLILGLALLPWTPVYFAVVGEEIDFSVVLAWLFGCFSPLLSGLIVTIGDRFMANRWHRMHAAYRVVYIHTMRRAAELAADLDLTREKIEQLLFWSMYFGMLDLVDGLVTIHPRRIRFKQNECEYCGKPFFGNSTEKEETEKDERRENQHEKTQPDSG